MKGIRIMREFAKDEIIRWKCENCGCRNKVYTVIRSNRTNKIVGSSLKCCNCGKVFERMNTVCDELENQNHCNHACEQFCIQLNYCPHTDCRLYGHNILDKKKEEPKGCSSCITKNCSNCCFKKSICDKLFYNTEIEPRFL